MATFPEALTVVERRSANRLGVREVDVLNCQHAWCMGSWICQKCGLTKQEFMMLSGPEARRRDRHGHL